MLCYRCGSYNPDGSRRCAVCGQAFSAQRRSSRNLSAQAPTASRVKAPYEPGTKIANRYRVTAGIAQGAAGWLLRARDEEVDVDVAVKIIAPKLLQTENDRSLFARAIKLARKVQHPNVARIYEEGTDDKQVFYTMPYLEGLTLRKIVDLRLDKGQVFSITETLPLFGQLALGLDNLEKLGAHGALRPGNIVVLPDILKITGLPHWHGLPRKPFVAQHSQRHTLEYLAPEARHEEVQIDSRADVYSMAVIFGEMLTGHVYGRDAAAWTQAQQRLPGRLANVLAKALADQAAERFASASAFFDALAEAVADLQFDASEPVPLGSPAAKPRALGDERTIVEGVETSDVSPSPFHPEAAASSLLEPTDARLQTRPSEPGSIAAVEDSAPVPLAKPIGDLGRMGERRGKARGEGAGSHLFIWAAVALLGLAGGIVGAALWYRQQRPSVDLQPVGRVLTPAVGTTAITRPTAPGTQKPATGATAGTAAPGKDVSPTTPVSPQPAPAAVGASAPSKPATPPTPEPAKPAPEVRPVVLKPEPQKPETQKPEPPKPEPARVEAKGCPPGMIEIPAGNFLFGSTASDPLRGFGELDAKSQSLGSYCIDMYEYPNQRGKAPSTNVNWTKAKQSCEKQGKRLCSEAEWERACKGSSGGAAFPFGGSFSNGICNLGDGGSADKKPVSAGEFGRCRSGFGVADMAGNAAEWTGSRWADDVPDKVVKGGGSDQASYTGRCAARANEPSGARRETLGFRCCADPGR